MRLRTPSDIGALIRERRRALGLDQRTLALRVGVSRQWIVEAEGGKRGAPVGLVLRTLETLGVGLRAGEDAAPAPGGRTVGAAVDIDGILAAHRRKGVAKR
ncbi:MAG: HTH-type transcriptional regulator antitoxin [Planctomycetota bacterium]|nr:MAG: HTH-type transcriptional regulator antitoxin [Planctomycetota bacterium]